MTELLNAVIENNIEEVKRLLEDKKYLRDTALHVVDVIVEDEEDEEDEEGTFYSPIAYALRKGHIEMVRFFLEKGVKINLSFAILIANEDIVNMLLEEVVDVNDDQHSQGCETPLLSAVQSGNYEITKRLLEKGANVNATPPGYGSSYRTPLEVAVGNGNVELMNLLIKEGGDINVKDDRHFLLRDAVCNGRTEVVEFLLDKGIEIDIRNALGNTTLRDAVKKGHTDIVKLLIEKGADVNTKDNKGRTPLDVAIWKEQDEIKCLLLANGAVSTPGAVFLNPPSFDSWDVNESIDWKGAFSNAKSLSGDAD